MQKSDRADLDVARDQRSLSTRAHLARDRAIRVLDEATVAQIAAGEVIERPVSVVKELVENSLDAGARTITVDVTDGGRTLISVTDDGCGIPRHDLPLAVARYATSKLSRAEDLFAVATLGFRGEGLASIAAAGRLEIISRVSSGELGAKLSAFGTTIGEPETVAAPPGTKVVVRDLFALTPARREFLKSSRAEFARISDFLSRLALGWPAVTFRLRHDDRDVWVLPAAHDPIDRIEFVFGKSARGALLRLEGDAAGVVLVSGYVSRPGEDRPTRNQQAFFVNGRLVRCAALGAAWLAGHGSYAMTGRYPFGVIALRVPPDEVDPNVHPTKIEVRFLSQATVFDAVRSAVARALRAAAPPASPLVVTRRAGAQDSNGATSEAFPAQDTLFADPGAGGQPVRFFGQIDQTYIAAWDADGLLLIDQHAAHERIAYEALQALAGREPGAPPLLPSIVDLTPAQSALLGEFSEELAQVGVIVEPFGDGAYRIAELPSGYERRRFDLARILEDLAADDAPREGIAHRNRVIATIACHSVVRAHEPLSIPEQAELYARLSACQDPATCPHGRPTMLRLDASALRKAFGRS